MTVSRPDNRVARIFLSEKFIRLKEAHPFTLTCSGECNEQAVKNSPVAADLNERNTASSRTYTFKKIQPTDQQDQACPEVQLHL
jgi:hypothetical protein